MKHLYQPRIPMMTIYATPDELIAIGTVIMRHLNWIERTANKTNDQLELIALLQSFQGRVVANQPTMPPGLREVQ